MHWELSVYTEGDDYVGGSGPPLPYFACMHAV